MVKPFDQHWALAINGDNIFQLFSTYIVVKIIKKLSLIFDYVFSFWDTSNTLFYCLSKSILKMRKPLKQTYFFFEKKYRHRFFFTGCSIKYIPIIKKLQRRFFRLVHVQCNLNRILLEDSLSGPVSGQLPPRKIAPQIIGPRTIAPPDDFPPDNCPQIIAPWMIAPENYP